MQITLDDDRYERLRREAERTGASIAELIRRSIDVALPEQTREERLRHLQAAAGAWREEPGEDRAAYLEELRGPGLGHKLRQQDR
jgi:Ribbon-helix-helix protein, copG family